MHLNKKRILISVICILSLLLSGCAQQSTDTASDNNTTQNDAENTQTTKETNSTDTDNTNKTAETESPTEKVQSENDTTQTTEDVNSPIALLKIKDMGTIKIALFPEIAPNTVNNFISLAQSGYYDGLIFHRVIDGFMIQGGDPTGTGRGGPNYSIKGEFSSNNFDNPLSHTEGVISMARSNHPDSAGSQFFIVHEDSQFLDGEYAAFGITLEGMDIVDKIAKTETGAADKPKTDIIIESATIELNGYEPAEPEKITQ